MIIPYHIFLYKWNLYKKIWYQVIPTSFLDSSAGFMLLSAMWFCFCDDDDDVVIYCVLHVGDCSLFILAQKIKMKNMECPVSLPNQIMTFCKKVFNLGKSFFQVFLNTILFYVNNTLILFFFLSGGHFQSLNVKNTLYMIILCIMIVLTKIKDGSFMNSQSSCFGAVMFISLYF